MKKAATLLWSPLGKAKRSTAQSGLSAAGFGRLDPFLYAGLEKKLSLAHISHQTFLNAFSFEKL